MAISSILNTKIDDDGDTTELIIAENASSHIAPAVVIVDADGNVAPTSTASGDFGFNIVDGSLSGYTVEKKFGHNDAIGTSFVPISDGGIYPTPQVSGATTLRIKAGGDADDTAAGSGAREVTLYGLDETGALVSESLATNGISASSATTITFLRLFRAVVTASGSYATVFSGSHDNTITIENGVGGTDWGNISFHDFAHSQSEIGVYTIPLGKTGYIRSITIDVDSTKSVDVLMFKRENILETSAPYTAMRVVENFTGVSGEIREPFTEPLGPYPALTDIGFMGKVDSSTAGAAVKFSLILVDD